ncbi:GTPase RsgA, partial [Streptococcus suis]
NSLVRPTIVHIDHEVVIMSAKEHDYNANLLDRFLVLLEQKDMDPIIYSSKMDLVEDRAAMDAFKAVYEKIGYPVGSSVADLTPLLQDK